MRMDTKIYFVTESEPTYDPSTGDYISGVPIKEPMWANVSDTGTTRMTLLYGSIKRGAKTVRLNNSYTKPFDYIEIDGKLYSDTLGKRGQNKTVYEVSER